MDDDNLSVQLCGLTEAQINQKHLNLRGTMELKYPPVTASCTAICNCGAHRCFLRPGQHQHEFSSECFAVK